MTKPASIYRQKTLARTAEFAGVGLFTGQPSTIRIVPSPADSGVVFQRLDLPGKPKVPALLQFVSETPRCTCLSNGLAKIQMVEHLMSALRGMEIDNALIEIYGAEIPASDGSSREFVRIIEEAGVQTQETPQRVIRIEQPIYWSEGECHLIALPFPGFRISYTLHYPHSPLIRSQYFSFSMTPELYQTEISPCRTFSLYEEIAPLLEKGLIKGGGLDKGVVIQGDRILNPEGSRFLDEMVRHKILDLIGDLALLGAVVEGHIFAVRSGHAANVAFAKGIEKTVQGMK